MDEFGDRAVYATEYWGESPLAERHKIAKYPAVFINGKLFATPFDLGFVTTETGQGRYMPWPSEEMSVKFKEDFRRALAAELKGEEWPDGLDQTAPELRVAKPAAGR